MKDKTGKIQDFKYRSAEVLNRGEDEIRVVVTPLRICPLGAHVDHQMGLVSGMPIDEYILLGFVPGNDSKVRVQSANFRGMKKFDLKNIPLAKKGEWGNYIHGAAEILVKNYNITKGMDAFIEGYMPIGGLSSSAAVGISYLLALENSNDLEVSRKENIELDRYIENEYMGLKNGILDQSIILMGEEGCLTYLDCESIEFSKHPSKNIGKDYEILVVYSGVNENLAGTDYNNRVKECEIAAVMLLEKAGQKGVENPTLRKVGENVWNEFGEDIPDPFRKRARHFFTECERVRNGIHLWEDGNLLEFGKLINTSCESSITNYESGCAQLITIYEILNSARGVYGLRFSGGGFRGSCIGFIDPTYKVEIVERIERMYPVKHPKYKDSYSVHFCRTGSGARILV